MHYGRLSIGCKVFNILEQDGTGNNIQVKPLALWVYAENGSLHHFNILHFQSYKSHVSGPTVYQNYNETSIKTFFTANFITIIIIISLDRITGCRTKQQIKNEQREKDGKF